MFHAASATDIATDATFFILFSLRYAACTLRPWRETFSNLQSKVVILQPLINCFFQFHIKFFFPLGNSIQFIGEFVVSIGLVAAVFVQT